MQLGAGVVLGLQQAGDEQRFVVGDGAGFFLEADVVGVDAGQLGAVGLHPAALAGLAQQREQLAAAGLADLVQVQELDQGGALGALALHHCGVIPTRPLSASAWNRSRSA